MIDRIEKLINDPRLDILSLQKEFIGIKEKLGNAFRVISILPEIEKHIKAIDPHEKTMTVNGEEAIVHFVTRQPE